MFKQLKKEEIEAAAVTVRDTAARIIPLVKQWRDATNISLKSNWFCTGKVTPPTIQVANHSMRYKLMLNDIREIKEVATIAPFGKGSETVIDETVRKGLQVDKSLVQFTASESWNKRLQAISAELCNAYNEKDIELVFYKMLLYEEGGHFAAHKDTLRDKNHIASLLISLPVEGGCEGGVLQVKDVSSNVTMEWDGKCEDVEASWCSFYTDCMHELKPLTSGARVVLAYEVHSVKVDVQLNKHVKMIDEQAPIVELASSENVMAKVVESSLSHKDNVLILLKHMYSCGCEPKNLKGTDRAILECIASSFDSNYHVAVEPMKFDIEWLGDEGDFQETDSRKFSLFLKNKLLLGVEVSGRMGFAQMLMGGFIQNGGIPYMGDNEFGEYEDEVIDVEEKNAKEQKYVHVDYDSDKKHHGVYDNYDNEGDDREFDEYSIEYAKIPRYQHIYFNTPNHLCLFNSDDFTNKREWQFRPCGTQGNEGAPEELQYQFYVLRVSKLR